METFSIRKYNKQTNPLPEQIIQRIINLGFQDKGNTYEIPLQELLIKTS